MKLFLVRHGEAAPFEPDPPLSERGIEETTKVSKLFQTLGLEVTEILHSPKNRTRQTAEIFGNQIGCKTCVHQGLKPNDPLDPILNEIALFERPLLIVSHLPFVERLTSYLLFHEERTDWIDFCPSCLVCLEGGKERWRLQWILSPLMLA